MPPFQPSLPLDQATGLNEGLFYCNEYQMPVPALRPIYLKPFLSCLEELHQTFDSAGAYFTFQTFLSELRKKYSLIEEVEWSPRLGAEYEIAIHAIERKISHGGIFNQSFTPKEQELALHLFPTTSKLLDARKWDLSRSSQFDPELEKIYAGIASFFSHSPSKNILLFEVSVPIEPGPLQTQHEQHCKNLREFEEQIGQLTSIWKDLKILSRLFPKGPNEPASFRQTLARYRKLMSEAKEKLKEFKSIKKMPRPFNFCYGSFPGRGFENYGSIS
ncbi:MAG: hypothetical protein ABIQ95_14260 [Bdellovibrionia bacterium]